MKLGTRCFGFGVMFSSLLLAGCSSDDDEDPHTESPPHWSYSGTEGPEYWGSLSDEYAACDSGDFQSPVDLPASLPAEPLEHLDFDYMPTSGTMVDNGHTIVVEFDENTNEVLVDGKAYTLLQFHFHAESEHQVDGAAAPLEMHLVHQASDGGLAVVGIFFEEGEENDPLAEVFASMTNASSEALPLSSIDLLGLLPQGDLGWTYSGSLTTPPCSEGVSWSVFASPTTASAVQLQAFAELYAGSNRPVQENEDIEEQLAQETDDEGDS